MPLHALVKTATCIALLYAAERSAGTAALDSLARYVALIYAAACAAAFNGPAMCLGMLYAAVCI